MTQLGGGTIIGLLTPSQVRSVDLTPGTRWVKYDNDDEGNDAEVDLSEEVYEEREHCSLNRKERLRTPPRILVFQA